MDAENHQFHFLVAIQQWTSKHNLLCPPEAEILEEWRGIWGTHQCYIQDKWTVEDVRQLFDAAKSLVWHVRDHEGSHLHVFCPVKYWTMLSNTFGATQVLRNPFLTCSQTNVQVEQRVPPAILDDFSYGFRFRVSACNLPYAYILPKHKKNWKGGRPIVSVASRLAKKFLTVLSKEVDTLTSDVCPHSRGYNDAITLWHVLHRFLDQDRPDEEWLNMCALHNQDLAGFFVSIPVIRFQKCLRLLLIRFYALDPDDDLTSQLEGISMTVSISRDLSVMRAFRGRYRGARNQNTMWSRCTS